MGSRTSDDDSDRAAPVMAARHARGPTTNSSPQSSPSFAVGPPLQQLSVQQRTTSDESLASYAMSPNTAMPANHKTGVYYSSIPFDHPNARAADADNLNAASFQSGIALYAPSQLSSHPSQESLSSATRPSPEPQPVFDPFQDRGVKHRRRTTAAQLKVLEAQFSQNSKPDIPIRKSLSDQLSMTPREVQVWFQNRRAKAKRLDRKAQAHAYATTSQEGHPDELEDLEPTEGASWTPQAQPADSPYDELPPTLGAVSIPGQPPGWHHRRATLAGLPMAPNPFPPHSQAIDEAARKMSLPVGYLVTPFSLEGPPAAMSHQHLQRIQIPANPYDHAPYSAPHDQPFYSDSYPAARPISAQKVQKMDPDAEPAHRQPEQRHLQHLLDAESPESEYSRYIAATQNQRYRWERTNSNATTASYDPSTHSVGPSSPTSVASAWSYQTAVTTPSENFPSGFDPDIRRASCPAGLANPMMPYVGHGVPSVAPLPTSMAPPPNSGPAAVFPDYFPAHNFPPSEVYQPFHLPDNSHGMRAPMFSQPFHASGAQPGYGSSHHQQQHHHQQQQQQQQQQQLDAANRRMSIGGSLDAIAEQPLHQPVPFAPAPRFVLNDPEQEAAGAHAQDDGRQRPLFTRKARSQTSIKTVPSCSSPRLATSFA